jgi:polyhydroxyalkanoate synthesis repressor PhaR
LVLIKRYTNRKLYDTTSGRYVTLEDIAALVRAGEDVSVIDHVSGRDLTSLVLLQVVIGEEKRLGEMLPRAVLTHLLRAGEERFDTLRARILAAFDPNRHLEEELRRRMDQLVGRGEISAGEAGHLLEQLLRREEPETNPVDTESEQTLAALQLQLDELERQLAVLIHEKADLAGSD